MDFPEELYYTDQDEWLRVEDGEAVIGITDYAQDELGDIVYVELPETGTRFGRGDAFGVIESVKAVADLYAPVAGEVVGRNDRLTDEPELVNDAPYGDGWMIRIRMDDPAQADELMSAEAYRAQLPSG